MKALHRRLVPELWPGPDCVVCSSFCCPSDRVNMARTDANGRLRVLADRGKLLLVDLEAGWAVRVFGDAKVTALAVGADAVWMGTAASPSEYSLLGEPLFHSDERSAVETGLRGTHIQSPLADSQGTLWAGIYEAGLHRSCPAARGFAGVVRGSENSRWRCGSCRGHSPCRGLWYRWRCRSTAPRRKCAMRAVRSGRNPPSP